MSKIGDLIVRLLLRREDYEKGLDKSKRKTDDFAAAMKKSWVAAVGKVTAVTAAVYGTFKALDKVAHRSQQLGDQWDRLTAGMTAAWETFVTGVTSGELSGLFGQMAEAARAAADLQTAIDGIGEASTAAAILEGRNYERYLELQEKARDVNLSAKDRLAAIQEMKGLIEEQTIGLASAYGEAAEKAIDQFLVRMHRGLSAQDITAEMREQFQDFLVWMGNKGAGFAEANDILGLKDQIKALETTQNMLAAQGMDTKPQRAEIARLRASLDELTASYKANGYSLDYLNDLQEYNARTNDKLREPIDKYIPLAAQQSNAAAEQTKRFTTLANSILKSCKSADEIIALLPYLKDGLAELFAVQTAPDFVGPVSEDVQRILDIIANLGKPTGNPGGKSAFDIYSDKIKDIKAQYEQYLRWQKSGDLEVLQANKAHYAELSKNGATYLEFLQKEREKFAGKDRLTALQQKELDLLNNEIATLTQLSEIKADDVQLKSFNDELDRLIEDLEKLDDLEVDIPLPDPHGMFDTLEEWNEYFDAIADKANDLNESLKDAIVNGISDSIGVLMDGLMGLEDVNGGKIMQALLTPLADVAVQAGEMIMAQGIAVEAFKTSLTSLNGYAAIAAGAALIMVGQAAKAGLKALANGTPANTSAVTAAATSSYTGSVENRSEIVIYVRGKLDGSDIVLSGERTLDKWGR